MSASLSFDAVTCVRGGRSLFGRLSFALGPGGAALVTGANGVGKSSLVRIAAGLLAPAAGMVTVAGARALSAEATALDAELPLAAALGFWARIDDGGATMAAAMAAFDLARLADVPIRLLSTGQRKRAALARVAASGAALWLLDEPANGLDAGAVAMLEAAIARHRASGGIALVTTHSPISIDAARHIDLDGAA